jgi:hypothetical protein
MEGYEKGVPKNYLKILFGFMNVKIAIVSKLFVLYKCCVLHCTLPSKQKTTISPDLRRREWMF